MVHRIRDELLEIQHPETGAYLPAIVLIPGSNGWEVQLNSQQQGLITKVLDALIQDRGTQNEVSRLADLLTKIDTVEPSLGQLVNAVKTDQSSVLTVLTTISGALVGDVTALNTLKVIKSALASADATVLSLLTQLVAKLGTIGPQPMAGSAPVVIATDQTPVPVSISAAPVTLSDYNKMGTSAGENIKNSAGILMSSYCHSLVSTTRYLQFFDSTAAPTGTPRKSYAVFAGATLFLGPDFLTDNGLSFTTGITWGLSTTALTYTAAATSDCIFEARYR